MYCQSTKHILDMMGIMLWGVRAVISKISENAPLLTSKWSGLALFKGSCKSKVNDLHGVCPLPRLNAQRVSHASKLFATLVAAFPGQSTLVTCNSKRCKDHAFPALIILASTGPWLTTAVCRRQAYDKHQALYTVLHSLMYRHLTTFWIQMHTVLQCCT
jgi:hypothetical protein